MMTKEQIIQQLNNPKELEALYRQDKAEFRKTFNLIYSEIKSHNSAQIWFERLNYRQETGKPKSKNQFIFVIALAIVAGFVTKMPDIFNLRADLFFQRNIGFVVFPFLIAFFSRKNKNSLLKNLLMVASLLVFVVYINLLPKNESSDTLLLACVHLQLILWLMLGFSFSGNEFKNHETRMNFLRYNGDLIVMSVIILLAGSLFSSITIGLFSIIGIDISEIYAKYVIIWGLPAVPLVATYLIQNNPQLVNKVSPIIAKVFTPLVLVTLCIYLPALLFSDKDPYQNRDFLIIFNTLLIGVLALIFFSISEHTKSVVSKTNLILLLSLTAITVVINSIALSAIIFRIAEWGITPNRLAVMGGTLVILINLLLIGFGLFGSVTKNVGIELVEKRITGYLTLYGLWAGIVIFLFPILFKFA
jgi:hypothetical protein